MRTEARTKPTMTGWSPHEATCWWSPLVIDIVSSPFFMTLMVVGPSAPSTAVPALADLARCPVPLPVLLVHPE
jgi:hypothetical protein